MRSSPSHSPTPLVAPIPGHSPSSPAPPPPELPQSRPSPPPPELPQSRPSPPSPKTAQLNRAHRPPEITQLDTELHRLARGAGRLRLRIGQALHRLADGIHELGFSTLGAYALERCNRGGRWAAESRTLARRLQSLPQLTQALESGAIGWSMAELLARHATPQTEAALLTIARGQTVQSMRLAFARERAPKNKARVRRPRRTSHRMRRPRRRRPHPHPLTHPPSRRSLGARSHPHDGRTHGRQTHRRPLPRITPSRSHHPPARANRPRASQRNRSSPSTRPSDQANQADQADQPKPTSPTSPHRWKPSTPRGARRCSTSNTNKPKPSSKAAPRSPTDPNPGEAPDPSDLPTGLQALDARIRHYSAELASRDLFFGRIAQRFLALRGWQTLGFTTEAHYARERLGMSRASLRSKLSLARRSQALHQVADALQQGQIGFEAAHLIARIATPTTERAWLTRATRRTFKHLREEVQAIEMATRFAGATESLPTKPRANRSNAGARTRHPKRRPLTTSHPGSSIRTQWTRRQT